MGFGTRLTAAKLRRRVMRITPQEFKTRPQLAAFALRLEKSGRLPPGTVAGGINVKVEKDG